MWVSKPDGIAGVPWWSVFAMVCGTMLVVHGDVYRGSLMIAMSAIARLISYCVNHEMRSREARGESR